MHNKATDSQQAGLGLAAARLRDEMRVRVRFAPLRVTKPIARNLAGMRDPDRYKPEIRTRDDLLHMIARAVPLQLNYLD